MLFNGKKNIVMNENNMNRAYGEAVENIRRTLQNHGAWYIVASLDKTTRCPACDGDTLKADKELCSTCLNTGYRLSFHRTKMRHNLGSASAYTNADQYEYAIGERSFPIFYAVGTRYKTIPLSVGDLVFTVLWDKENLDLIPYSGYPQKVLATHQVNSYDPILDNLSRITHFECRSTKLTNFDLDRVLYIIKSSLLYTDWIY